MMVLLGMEDVHQAHRIPDSYIHCFPPNHVYLFMMQFGYLGK